MLDESGNQFIRGQQRSTQKHAVHLRLQGSDTAASSRI